MARGGEQTYKHNEENRAARFFSKIIGGMSLQDLQCMLNFNCMFDKNLYLWQGLQVPVQTLTGYLAMASYLVVRKSQSKTYLGKESTQD